MKLPLLPCRSPLTSDISSASFAGAAIVICIAKRNVLELEVCWGLCQRRAPGNYTLSGELQRRQCITGLRKAVEAVQPDAAACIARVLGPAQEGGKTSIQLKPILSSEFRIDRQELVVSCPVWQCMPTVGTGTHSNATSRPPELSGHRPLHCGPHACPGLQAS